VPNNRRIAVGDRLGMGFTRCSASLDAEGQADYVRQLEVPVVRRDIVVIGASAGGFKPLKELLGLLPGDLECSLFIVLHRATTPSGDFLTDLLRDKTKLPVIAARGLDVFRPGHVYVAPPRCHLLIEDGHVRVDEATDPNPSRVGIDNLFRSAALSYGERVVAIVLSGMLDDGALGLREVRRHGGITIVQDPAASEVSSMPRSAIAELPVHYCLTVKAIAQTIVRVARDPVGDPAAAARPGVLIVEDERIVAMNLEGLLLDLGYRVVGSVASGEEALRLAPNAAPDVILMDVQLAGQMTGTEAGEALWMRLGVPIVYATAYSDEKTLTDSRASMPYGFVVKPYRASQLHATLQLALERRRQEMHRP
jgi:chemotaxis response regulator CheB